MNSPQEFLLRVTGLLDAAGVNYMVTGSIASAFYGEPRATRDIDLVIECGTRALARFIKLCDESGWYVSEEAARAALANRGMFNVIDPESGLKADLIVRKNRDFSIAEFERRTPHLIAGPEVSAIALASPEDVILSKLEWASQTGSAQQERDALRVAIARGASLDLAYLKRWAASLGVDRLLDELIEARNNDD